MERGTPSMAGSKSRPVSVMVPEVMTPAFRPASSKAMFTFAMVPAELLLAAGAYLLSAQGSVPVVSGFSRTSAAPGQQSAHRHRNQQQDREQLFHPRKNAQSKDISQAHSSIIAFFQHFLTSQKNRLFSQAVSRKHGSGQPTHFQVMGISISGCRLCLTGQLRAACSSSFLSG